APSHPVGGCTELFSDSVRRQRGHRVVPGAAISRTDGTGSRTGDAQFPLHTVVIGSELVVSEWPVRQGAVLGNAVNRGHREVLVEKPPRHSLPPAWPAA